MTVEIKITYDPSSETLNQAIASLIEDHQANMVIPGQLTLFENPQPDAPQEKTKAPAEKKQEEPVKQEESKAAPAAQVSKTDIRAIATALSKAGKKAELKAALEAFGATKLSDVNEADYPALKEKLEAVNA